MPVLTHADAAGIGTLANRGSTLSIVVDPFEVDEMLDLVMARLGGYNLSLWLRDKAQPHFAEEIKGRFASEGDRKTGAWEELHDATQNIRTELGYGAAHPINVRSGEMLSYLTEHFDISLGADYASIDLPGETSDPVLAEKIRTAQEGNPTNSNERFGATNPRPVMAEPDNGDMQDLLESLQGWIMLEVAGVLS